jgi:hypothetical protein
MFAWLGRLIGDGEGAEIREGLRRIARDAFYLEVNTIAKAGMTARKMPDPPHALLDVAGKYYWYLLDLSRKYDEPEAAAIIARLTPEERTNGTRTFETIRMACGHLLRAAQSNPGIPAGDCVIVERVLRNCLELEALILRAAAENPHWLFHATRAELVEGVSEVREVRLPVDDLAILRRIWEVGVESVLMQSVIGLDGNVVTRIHHARDQADSKALHDLHLAATRTAVETWSTVVKLLATLIHRLVALIAPGR